MTKSARRERIRAPARVKAPLGCSVVLTLHVCLVTCVHRRSVAYVPRSTQPPQGVIESRRCRHQTSNLQRTTTSAPSLFIVGGGKGQNIIPFQEDQYLTQIRSKNTDESEIAGGGAVGAKSVFGGRALLLGAALACISVLSTLAKAGILPGSNNVIVSDASEVASAFSAYTDAMILRDVGATLLTLVLATAFVKANTAAAASGLVEPRDSRKLIHTLSAPLFMLTWPLFSSAIGARYFAAIVPLMNGLRLVLAGKGGSDGDEKELAGAISRSGDASEALGGPFLYVLVLFASVLAFWTDNLTGVLAASTMAAGDGVADLVGRRYGKGNKWFFAPDKSVAGSAAFVVAAALTSCGLAWWLGQTGALVLPMAFGDLAARIVVISFACAFVELVPLGDDNWTVPLSAAVLAAVFLR